MMGLLEENGPCFVAPDSSSTFLNPLSWNNDVNMLFIDQPNQVGFSYDIPTNGTQIPRDDGFGFDVVPGGFDDGAPPRGNLTTHVGTFSSQRASHTANATATAAHALWHFAQTWFFEFPHYKPSDDRVNLWTESYGGHYGPGFARFFQEQNDKIDKGTSDEKGAHHIHLDTLGIVNGLIDEVLQLEMSIEFPYNNVSEHPTHLIPPETQEGC
jgi:carboxypeptidase C (cathepsin A)